MTRKLAHKKNKNKQKPNQLNKQINKKHQGTNFTDGALK